MRPVAATKWGRGYHTSGDAQLEAIIQWLAASMACAPQFVCYTGGESRLEHVSMINM